MSYFVTFQPFNQIKIRFEYNQIDTLKMIVAMIARDGAELDSTNKNHDLAWLLGGPEGVYVCVWDNVIISWKLHVHVGSIGIVLYTSFLLLLASLLAPRAVPILLFAGSLWLQLGGCQLG